MEPSRIDLVLPRLACPVCGAGLARQERTVRCSAGHAFDLARQGYLPLLRGGARAGQGDTAEMVAARETFLGRGHYRPVSDAVTQAVAALPALATEPAPGAAAADAAAPAATPDRPPHLAPDDGGAPSTPPPSERPLIADLAGGTGHHLAAVLDHLPRAVGLCLELSAPALRRAARTHPRLAAVRADVWQPLPLRDGACDVVLSIFGPRNAAEMARVLAPGHGRLVVVTPRQEHLGELVGPLGMLRVAPDKSERLARQLAGFTVVDEHDVRRTAPLTRDDVRHEVLMGPSAHHVDPAGLTRAVASFPPVTEVTVAVTVTTYRVA